MGVKHMTTDWHRFAQLTTLVAPHASLACMDALQPQKRFHRWLSKHLQAYALHFLFVLRPPPARMITIFPVFRRSMGQGKRKRKRERERKSRGSKRDRSATWNREAEWDHEASEK